MCLPVPRLTLCHSRLREVALITKCSAIVRAGSLLLCSLFLLRELAAQGVPAPSSGRRVPALLSAGPGDSH